MKAETIENHIIKKKAEIKEKIKQLNDKKNINRLTQEEIATKIGVNRVDLLAWLKKDDIWSYDKVLEVAKKLGL